MFGFPLDGLSEEDDPSCIFFFECFVCLIVSSAGGLVVFFKPNASAAPLEPQHRTSEVTAQNCSALSLITHKE